MIALLALSALAQDAPPPVSEPAPAPESAPAPAPAATPEPATESTPEPAPEPAPAPAPAPTPAPVEDPAARAEEAARAALEAAQQGPPIEPGPAYMGRPPRTYDSDDYVRYEISAELGSLGNHDPTWDLFSSRNDMPSWGFKAGYHPKRVVAFVGSWNLMRRGSTISVGGTDTDGDFQDDSGEFVAAMIAHEVTFGLKVDVVSFGDLLLPYVSAQGLLMIADLRFDDDISDRDNPGQVRGAGMTAGFLATAGAEVRLPAPSPVAAAWYLELGYGWLARASFGDFGTMKPGGLAIRSGLGLRWY